MKETALAELGQGTQVVSSWDGGFTRTPNLSNSVFTGTDGGRSALRVPDRDGYLCSSVSRMRLASKLTIFQVPCGLRT